jgi:alpha-D-xyloside xylohydrolase
LMHTVAHSVFAGISVIDQNYSTLLRGLRADIFLKNEFGNNYLAQVWPGPVYFPDFLHPKAQSWWTTEIAEFFKKVPFDGLWIDMNEAANFCSGSDCSFDATAGVPSFDGGCFLHCTTGSTQFDDPPYKIDHRGEYSEIGERSIAMTVKHYTGALEYDAHNLYGLSESIVTNKALKEVTKKRPFILSRSTFVSSGAHAAHWTGDNKATWEDLEYSVASVLNSGIFGVPMVGADICGFAGNATEELCNRWMQLGAFYPFARSHAEILSNPQEPYLWESVSISSRKALGLRYRLLPYMYTLMYEAHTQGFPIARPLFFGFPEDSITLTVSHQFLLGNGILVSPVLSPGQTSVNAYLPEGVWYNMFDFSKVTSQGAYHMLPAATHEINVHVHEGSVVPMQGSALTTAEVRNSPFTLLVALGKDLFTRAHGTLFLDSGDDLEMVLQNGKSTLVTYFVEASTGSGHMTASVIYGSYALQQGWQLHTVQILGIKHMPTEISINGEPVSLSAKAVFHPAKLFLEIHGLDLPVGKEFELVWETSSADILL